MDTIKFALFVTGCALITAGAALWSPIAGFVSAGVALIALSVLLQSSKPAGKGGSQ